MGNHNKVYGICESKCQVEVFPKERAYGIAKSDTYENTTSDKNLTLNLGLYESSCNTRTIIKNYGKLRLQTDLETFSDNFNLDIVFYNQRGFTQTAPQQIIDVWNINTGILLLKYITPNGFKASDYDVLHFHIFFDGLELCCRCEGYVR